MQFISFCVVKCHFQLHQVVSLLVMSELLFECYRVPSVAYGIDGLFSLYYNQSQSSQLHHGLPDSCCLMAMGHVWIRECFSH